MSGKDIPNFLETSEYSPYPKSMDYTNANKTFLNILQDYFDKMPNRNLITNVWQEIINGRRSLISSHALIEYSFHYPVDTDMYLSELLNKFDDCIKEDLRTISGSLKAYLLIFLYHCLGSTERLPMKTSLYAAELYLKLILLSPDIGKLYYEKNMYCMILYMLNRISKKPTLPVEPTQVVLEMTLKFISRDEMETMQLLAGTANVYANIVKYRAKTGEIKQFDDPLGLYCLKCIKELIIVKEHPQELQYIMKSLLRCLLKDDCIQSTEEQRQRAAIITRNFIEKTLFVEIEDKNKHRYFLDSLFSVLGSPDLDLVQDCIHIINLLDEELYKEFLRRASNHLESSNHENYYVNLMHVVYYLLAQPHPKKFQKLDVLFAVCLKSVVIHLLDKNLQIQDRTIEVLAKICLLENNRILTTIIENVNITGEIAGLEAEGILAALVKILGSQYEGHSERSKHVLHIVSRLLIGISKLDGDLSCESLYLICKDGTPFSVKNILPNLHSLFLKLSDRVNCAARTAIIRIFLKMAMHSDASSSIFIEHLYKCIIFSSKVNGVEYGPEKYSNELISDEFDYDLFLAKSRHLIEYKHVRHLIKNFNHREPGYSLLLHALLDFVKYKEYNVMTNYFLNNLEDLSCIDACSHLFGSYKRILLNNSVYLESDMPKFHRLHDFLWNSLYGQCCGITSIKPSFDLIQTLKKILGLDDEADAERRARLLKISGDSAYKALLQKQYFMGSVMHLTEICIALRRAPRVEILNIFETLGTDRRAKKLLQTVYKDTLIQLTAFYGTLSMIDRSRISIAVMFFKLALDVTDPIVQLTAIKMYYTLASEITREFDEIITFCFNHMTSEHTVLSRVCATILEELIHENYIMLTSETFMRFVHRLASRSLGNYMVHLLNQRFLVSNKSDVGRFYITTLVYMSGYTRFDSFPIEFNFRLSLIEMRNLLDFPNDLIRFLFSSLQVKTRFNTLKQMCEIFDCLVAGKCKIDDNFFTFLNYSLYTFKVMSCKPEFDYREQHYVNICRSIEKQIFNKDPSYEGLMFYGEYDAEVKYCTKSLLNLLFFIQDEQRLKEQFYPVFDTVLIWIDHIKPELVQYIHQQRYRDLDHKLRKLVQSIKIYKGGLFNYISNQEGRILVPAMEHMDE